MKKELKLKLCRECKRKRFCSRIPVPNHNWKWTCSRGHSWVEVGITLGRINRLYDEIVLPRVKDLFDRDDTFYKIIKK